MHGPAASSSQPHAAAAVGGPSRLIEASPRPPHRARSASRVSARADAAWRLGAITVVWATCLYVLALWIAGGGVEAIAGIDAESVASIGRLTGLVSANLLLLQVLLMARVPIFERGFGRSGMTRMHRLTGIWSFSLLLAHMALIVAAYAMQDAMNVFAESWNLVANYPGMLLAVLGVVAIIIVMWSSARVRRRRLRYESWHLLHLYGYLGIGLAVPHMLWTGQDFVTSLPATVYWWSLWGATAACVIVFRIAVPLRRSRRHGLRVVAVSPDGDRGVTVRMAGRDLHLLNPLPGQFFVWRFLDGDGWTRGNPFSLSAAPNGRELQISAKRVGDGTARLDRLRPGTRVLIEGPYGHMTGARRTAPKLLMIGAGAGVAPLISLLESEHFAPGEAVLITRDRSAEERMRRGAIRRLVAERGLVHYALDGSRAGAGWLNGQHAAWQGHELLRRLAPGVDDCDVYLCGPPLWMAAVRDDLRTAGFPARRIHAEFFSIDPAGDSVSAAPAPPARRNGARP